MKRRVFITATTAALAAGEWGIARAERTQASVTTLAADGGHLDWLKIPGGSIAFDRIGSSGFFELWVMQSDGSRARNLSAGRPQFAGVHVGQPAWHPSGRWIAFQAQKQSAPRRYENVARPGAGVFNDLWIMSADGRVLHRLVELPLTVDANARGILHPHFSPDGRRLIWAERTAGGRQPFGVWTIRLADFIEDGGAPRVGNVRSIAPRGAAFYETHGFAPDGRRFLFCSDGDGGLQLYEYDLAAGSTRKLTHDRRVWSEHAHYAPHGRSILYMSSENLGFRVQPKFHLETEFWLMRTDGSQRRRITFFHQPGHPHHRTGIAIAADSAWRHDGNAFCGLVIRHLPDTVRRGSGEVVLIELA